MILTTNGNFASTFSLAILLSSASSKYVMVDKEIVSEQLALDDIQEMYADRINPGSNRKVESFSVRDENNLESGNIRRRVTRDTLLNLYRQKQLYKNLNRNLYQSYFQSAAGSDVVSPSVRNVQGFSSNFNQGSGTNAFKKIITNPYKDYAKAKMADGNNIRPIYKKHPGFHVTDSVNHLKYLVPKKNTQGSNRNIGSSREFDDSQVEVAASRMQLSNSNSASSIKEEKSGGPQTPNKLESNRMRRGEFYHRKPGMESSRTFLDRLKADSLRI